MKSNVQTLLALFEPKRRYIVPMFQRQYVWSQERQWAPLWDDIERKVIERLRWNERLKTADPEEKAQLKAHPPTEHFLGAIVLDLHPTYGNEVSAKLIIDGQQRLTTIQLFLAALRDVAISHSVAEYPAEIDGYVSNKGIMADRKVERYKVWPSKFDQDSFKEIVDANESGEDSGAEPGHEKSPTRLAMAYSFFSRKLDDFLGREVLSDRLQTQPDTYGRVKTIFEAFDIDIQIVSIELEGQDDPQIIFETLNARGQPLLPSDLLRNYLFWRASREHAKDVEHLYDSYWSHFDSDFWKKEERQGRLTRPRVDLFFYNLLQLKTGDEVNAPRLYHEYKVWSENEAGYKDVRYELKDIHRYSLELEKVFRPDPNTSIGRFAQMLQILDVGTINSLLLGVLADGKLSEVEFDIILVDLESYLVRRAICGMTAQGYNRLFVSWIARLRKGSVSHKRLQDIMLSEEAESTVWPDDPRFHGSWVNEPLYRRLYSRGRMEYILRRIEMSLHTRKHEKVTIGPGLTIEHVLPQEWIRHWRLPGGRRGVPADKRITRPSPASDARDRALHTIGNLTLLTGPLNSTNRNREFEYKVRKIKEYSLLAMNNYFRKRMDKGLGWDEAAIEERGLSLFEIASKIWPYPDRRT